jgi:hypothetical protein
MDQGAMMTYFYDIFGNVTTNADPQRSTTIVPLICPNGQQANWTGSGWACIVFNAPVSPVATPPVYLWFLDVGAFFDRFGPAMLPALMSADPVLQAIIRNIQSREWVDLKNPQVAAAVVYMSGTAVVGLGTISAPIAGMTADLATAIMTTQPTAQEQFATVMKFFT